MKGQNECILLICFKKREALEITDNTEQSCLATDCENFDKRTQSTHVYVCDVVRFEIT